MTAYFRPLGVYPPYQTDAFQKCPTLWDYQKRWAPRGNQRTAMLIGTGVAIGLEHYYKELMGEKVVRDPLGTALEYVEKHYQSHADKSLKGVETLVERGYDLGITTDLSIKEILAVEKYFGRIKPDIVARDYDGSLVVIDHKVKVNLDDKYLEGNLQEYDSANQFYHYAWGIEQEYGEPVARVVAHVIILAPVGKTLLHPVKMDPEHVQFWLKGTAVTWEHMKAVEGGGGLETRFASCKGRYGLCDMYEACHTFHGDESAFPALYERV